MFTDAIASDPELLSDAQDLIIQKSVTVTFALVNVLRKKRSGNDGIQDIQNTYKEKRNLMIHIMSLQHFPVDRY